MTSIQTEGPLFEAVQLGRIFDDSKTFVDAVPLRAADDIAARFARRDEGSFDLRQFVDEHFSVPERRPNARLDATSADQYARKAWPSLMRTNANVPTGSTLIPIPHPYVVPGGRFDELFYWDSYFTGLGMIAHGHVDLFAGMVDNFVHLQSTVGLIPNGSRTYLASRSQPPLLALMVQALGAQGRSTVGYLPALLAEHAFWMHSDRVTTVDGVALSRFWDPLTTPRPEAFFEDTHTSRGDPEVCRHLRAAAESGWDFSSRWCPADDSQNLSAIETTNVLPIDLNALLVVLELTIAGLSHADKNRKQASVFRTLGAERIDVLRRRCFDGATGWFHDLDRSTAERRPHLTMAGVVALISGVADWSQAAVMKDSMMTRFLAPGGLRASLVTSGQQWDAPSGWAPHQMWAIEGLRTYGFREEATIIADRWLATCRNRFLIDATLLEKYDVDDPTQLPGGGEYKVQEGFGWTNASVAVLGAAHTN